MVADKSVFDLRLSAMSAIVSVQKLGRIRDLSSPSLTAAEASCAGWLPQNRDQTIHRGADEIPLMATEIPSSRNKENRLFAAAYLDTHPGVVRILLQVIKADAVSSPV